MFRIAAFGLLFAASIAPVQAQVIEGPASVVDGDTIDMTETRIRIAHIDAPEAKQTCTKEDVEWACGKDATSELASIINGKAVVCSVISLDVYGRQVATCEAGIFNIGRELVRRGMAVVTENAPYEYAQAAEIAKRMKSGLWASTFAVPSAWRAANLQAEPQIVRREPAPEMVPQTGRERVYRGPSGCLIKGNRSRRGDWIYHLPGRPYYNETRAEEMFCTESEAQAAGYRRSRA